MIVLDLLSETLGGTLQMASSYRMSAEVELLAVVWEVRESVLYISSSPSLSSYTDMDSGEDGIVIEEAFRSAVASATAEASSCWVGPDFSLVVLLGVPLGTLATLGI